MKKNPANDGALELWHKERKGLEFWKVLGLVTNQYMKHPCSLSKADMQSFFHEAGSCVNGKCMKSKIMMMKWCNESVLM